MKKSNVKRELLKGFMDTIPLGLSASIYGVVYGVLAGKAGLSIWETIAMSCIVFAGASQMTAVQMIALGSSGVSIIITVFIINLRHFLLGASIAPYLRHESTGMKLLNAFLMTDESYAVTYSHYQSNPPTGKYFLGSGINIYILWGLSGAVGYFFGNIISSQLSYIFDFAFVAAFLGMLVPMIKGLPVLVAVLTSAIVSLLGSRFIPGKWYIIVAAIVASLAGYIASELKGSTEAKGNNRGGVQCED